MKLSIAIVFGGKSAEHEISLQSATNIINAMDTSKFTPLLLGVDKAGHWRYNPGYATASVDLVHSDYFQDAAPVFVSSENEKAIIVSRATHEILGAFDVVFPIIHGTSGEDGTLQGFLKFHRIPFVGPDILGSAIGMDKDVAKRLLRDKGIPVANGFVLHRHHPEELSFETAEQQLGLPLFVKPANAGSSVGVSKVNNKAEFEKAIRNAFLYDKKILIEEAVTGKEVECAVMGNEVVKASIVGEILPKKQFYSYEAKYLSADGADLNIPAQIEEAIAHKIRTTAVEAFQTLCCEGLARVDFFLRNDNTFVLNEINTLPGFTRISMYPKLWEKTGLSYPNLITELIGLAMKRQERDNYNVTAR